MIILTIYTLNIPCQSYQEFPYMMGNIKLIIIRYVNPDHSEPEELFRSNFEFGCQRFFNNIAKDGRTANNKQAVIQFS